MRRRHRRPVLPDSIKLPRRWPRHAWTVGIVALLTAGVFYERSTRPTVQRRDHARYHDRSFRVARVLDGDTIDIAIPDRDKAVTRIRLLGVDAPELAHRSGMDMHFGREATAFAERALGDRMVHVVLPTERTRGKYGRLLAYVYLERGGPMFNEMLLEEGFAYADLRFDHHYYNQFKAIEKRARKASKGLWADVSLDKMPEWKQRFERRASEGEG